VWNKDRSILNLGDELITGDEVYALFSNRLASGWLVGADGAAVIELANQKLTEFTQISPNFISIATTNAHEFIANLMAGLRLGIPIFICNPHWGKLEWDRVATLTAQVDIQQHRNTLMIPTGGSSGSIEFAIHTWETLSASVWGFQEFYEIDQISAVCTLPLYHVSGLMQLWRSLLTEGKLLITNFQQLCQDPNLATNKVNLNHYFISLVPTQLSKLLDLDSDWLSQFQTILLGGAPPHMELLARARVAKLPLALTYGMTETGSQITSLKPSEFLAGNNSCGRILPHAQIQFRSSTDRVTSIAIKAKSLMLGYFPKIESLTYFESDDLGSYDLDGYLTILGRNSGKIITGGENVFPLEVVNAIMATKLVTDVWIIGLPDQYWGQVVVAIYVKNHLPSSAEILSKSISGTISNYKIPKHWIPVVEIPRNALGKVLIQAAIEIAKIEVDKIRSY
jgi:o-succinylbenzoate---CoA ligase